uniref:Serine/arginine repetitive matrix protein 2 n=1 Tax=Streptomyces sp. NBC_00003 TaxID=2903608 RepID=A0AAU2V546_9ACTN
MSAGKDEVRWNAATQKWETVRDAASPAAPPPPPAPPPVPQAPPPAPGPATTYDHAHADPYRTAGPQLGPPAPPEPRPGRRVPVAVIVAMAFVVVAGAGGGWLLARGETHHPKAAATSPAPGSPSGTPDRTGDDKSSPSASASASPSATVPAGFRLAQDPKGFRLYVPQGWTREDQGPKGVFYNSADRTRLLQVYLVSEAGLSPYEALKQTSGELAKNPGYQEISLGNDATVPGVAAQAARLVYAYDNQQLGHRRQVVDYAFLTPGGEHYAVLSAGPAAAWPEQEQTLKTSLSVFCSGSNCPSR